MTELIDLSMLGKIPHLEFIELIDEEDELVDDSPRYLGVLEGTKIIGLKLFEYAEEQKKYCAKLRSYYGEDSRIMMIESSDLHVCDIRITRNGFVSCTTEGDVGLSSEFLQKVRREWFPFLKQRFLAGKELLILMLAYQRDDLVVAGIKKIV